MLGGEEIRGRKEIWVYNGRTFVVWDSYRWSMVNLMFFVTLSWAPNLLEECFHLDILQDDPAWLKLQIIYFI